MPLRRSTGSSPASRAVLLITGLLALFALALPGAAGAQETQPESVLVCLADDDGSYVLLSVAPSRVAEYRRNSRNIVPAPVSGCPANVQDSSGGTGDSGSSDDAASGGSSDEPAPESDEGSGTAGDEDSGSGSVTAGDEDSGSDEPSGGTEGESESGSEDSGSDEASEPSRLANTGSETWAVLGSGVLLMGLGTGIALRRRRDA